MAVATSPAMTAARASAAEANEVFTIRQLASEFDVSARTLRFYEEKGLLNPRRQGQDRLYSRRDRARLRYVVMGKTVGFTLEEIAELLDLYDLGDRQVTQLRATAKKFSERIQRLEHQKNEIDRVLAELVHGRSMVETMLATRERGGNPT